jgi:prevent-host-death family protein
MKSVNIAELKNRLSSYLNEVRAGDEIVVRDRDVPIARIVPLLPTDYGNDRLRLAATGRIRLGSAEELGEEFWRMPAPKISGRDARRLVDEERRED